MRFRSAILTALALSLVPAAAQGKPATKAPASHDWSRTVAATPEGGFRMGNPAAPVKLVEYGSLACPHCRHFEETGYQPLVNNYVRTGRVNYEFRNFLINGPDISISLLVRCAGPANFFKASEIAYAAQSDWQKKLETMSDADKAAFGKMTNQQAVVRFAELGGMAAIAARFGVPPPRARQCLSDPKQLQRLIDMTKKATDSGISHTPTFVINGKVSDAATWDALEPRLKAVLEHH